MHQTLHKHGRRAYLSNGIGGDSQSLLEPEPLRSKDRALLSYNIEIETYEQRPWHRQPCLFPKMILVHPSGTPLGRMPESRLTFNPRFKHGTKLVRMSDSSVCVNLVRMPALWIKAQIYIAMNEKYAHLDGFFSILELSPLEGQLHRGRSSPLSPLLSVQGYIMNNHIFILMTTI